MAYELLATRAELQAIVTATRTGAEADVRTLKGWRREVAGDELLELLGGRSSLTVVGPGIRHAYPDRTGERRRRRSPGVASAIRETNEGERRLGDVVYCSRPRSATARCQAK